MAAPTLCDRQLSVIARPVPTSHTRAGDNSMRMESVTSRHDCRCFEIFQRSEKSEILDNHRLQGEDIPANSGKCAIEQITTKSQSNH